MSNTVDITSLSSQPSPLSYINWLQLYQKNAVSEQTALTEYNQYIHDWNTNKNTSSQSDNDTIVNVYKNLLKEITINFTTEEEKRFLTNIDLNNKKDLDIAVPFFVRKLKEITQYFITKREEAKQAKIKYSFNGSELGLEKNIQQIIYSLVSNKDFTSQFAITTQFPALSTLISSMTISVQSLYDTTTTYFDQASGNNVIDPEPILDLQQAIIDLLYTFPVTLGTDPAGDDLLTSDMQTLLIDVERSDIQDLPYSEFVNSVKQLSNLNIAFQQSLYEKYLGTTFYYLSTGSTSADYLSGVLFEPTNPQSNILNRLFPTQVMIPDDSNVKTIEEIGSFFTPDKIGLLCFTSFTKDFSVETTSLTSNKVYIFPDPSLYGSARGNSYTDQIVPIVQREDVTSIKADNSNGLLAGDIISTNQKYFPYQSREESIQYQPDGVSRSYDTIDFFASNIKDIWLNADVYPLQPLEPLPLQERIDDLLITDDIVVQWKTDIFGNDFALYKKVEPKRKYNVITPVDKYSTVYEDPNTCRTFQANENDLGSDFIGLSAKRQVPGTVQVRSVFTPKVNTIVNSLSSVFSKYQNDTLVMNEMLSAVKDIDVFDDIIVIETETYLIVEKYTYNYTTCEFSSVNGKKILLPLLTQSLSSLLLTTDLTTIFADSTLYTADATSINLLSAYTDINFFRYVTPDELIFGKMSVYNGFSDNVTPEIVPTIYTINRKTLKIGKVFSPTNLAENDTTFTLSVSGYDTTVKNIDIPVIVYSSNENVYRFTFAATGLMGMPIIISFKFDPTIPIWSVVDTFAIIPNNLPPI